MLYRTTSLVGAALAALNTLMMALPAIAMAAVLVGCGPRTVEETPRPQTEQERFEGMALEDMTLAQMRRYHDQAEQAKAEANLKAAARLRVSPILSVTGLPMLAPGGERTACFILYERCSADGKPERKVEYRRCYETVAGAATMWMKQKPDLTPSDLIRRVGGALWPTRIIDGAAGPPISGGW